MFPQGGDLPKISLNVRQDWQNLCSVQLLQGHSTPADDPQEPERPSERVPAAQDEVPEEERASSGYRTPENRLETIAEGPDEDAAEVKAMKALPRGYKPLSLDLHKS